MNRHTRSRTPRVLGLILGLVLLVTGLSACWGDSHDVYSKPEDITCIYNNKTGQLDQQLEPGSKLASVNKDFETDTVVDSVRYWNFTETDAKDAASAGFVLSHDLTLKKVKVEGEVGFRFYDPNACKWNTEYGRRSWQGSSYPGMMFNVNGDPNTPWQQWLLRNFEVNGLSRVVDDIVPTYDWHYLQYEFPSNANVDGVIPDGQQPGESIYREIERKLSAALTNQLASNLAGQYFCGPGYDRSGADPSLCPALDVKITSITLVEPKPASAFEDLKQQREDTANAQASALLIEQGTQIDLQKHAAELAKQKGIADMDSQAVIEAKAREAAELTATQTVDALKAQQDAGSKLSSCAEAARINNAPISAADCAEIILALQGKSPVPAGGGVTVNAGSAG